LICSPQMNIRYLLVLMAFLIASGRSFSPVVDLLYPVELGILIFIYHVGMIKPFLLGR
jgi:hypothetical protein